MEGSLFGFLFVLTTSISLYGLSYIEGDFVLRWLATITESLSIVFVILSRWQQRRLRKIASQVVPTLRKKGAKKLASSPRTAKKTITQTSLHQQQKKNKMVEVKRAKKSVLLRYFGQMEQKVNMSKVVPKSNVLGKEILEEHFYDQETQYNETSSFGSVSKDMGCILLLKPSLRIAKEQEMMRHEEERQNMIFEDQWALRCRDEPKRLLELENLRREDERQQMFEWEMEQRRIEEEIRRRSEIKIMRRIENQQQAFKEDARSQKENLLYEKWLAMERKKQAIELDTMRQIEATQRMMSEELRVYWIQICKNHIVEMARDCELRSLYKMRREEEQQRMFEKLSHSSGAMLTYL